MKYYVVPTHSLSFKEEGKVIVPSKEAIEANLLEMLAKNAKDGDATIAFTRRADAEKLANEFDPEKKDHEGFAVIEISAPKEDYNEDDVEITLSKGKTAKLDGVLIPFAKMTFEKAHFAHLDASLKREVVAIAAKGSELLEKVTKPAAEEPAATEPKVATDADKAPEAETKAEASSSFDLKSFAKGLLITGAFAAAAYASLVSGITPAVLAYFGVKAGFAASLAASAALVATTSAVVYGAVRAATSFVKFVASKWNGKTEEVAAEDKPAADKPAEETKEVPDCCKGKTAEVKADEAKTDEAKADATAEVKKDFAEGAINSAKVLRFTPVEVKGAIKFATGSAQLENEEEIRGAIKYSMSKKR